MSRRECLDEARLEYLDSFPRYQPHDRIWAPDEDVRHSVAHFP